MVRAWVAASLAAAALVLPGFPSPASAVDVINQDDTPYFLIVVAADGEEDVVVNARSDLYDVCRGCLIRIDGIGEIRAEDDASILLIKDHQATVQPVPSLPLLRHAGTQPTLWGAPSTEKSTPAGRVF